MALSKNQISAALKLFGRGYMNSKDVQEKKALCREFMDAFKCDIKDIADEMKQALINKNASDEVIEEYEALVKGDVDTSFMDECVIAELSMDDEEQIVKLITKEIETMPRYSRYDVGTVDDFMKTGYSFVAKHDDQVVGVVLAHKHMEYGSYSIYLNIFAVNEAVQGHGVGRLMFNHLKALAKADKIYKFKLYTKKTLKAYEVYQHFGFKEDDEKDGVFMTGYFL